MACTTALFASKACLICFGFGKPAIPRFPFTPNLYPCSLNNQEPVLLARATDILRSLVNDKQLLAESAYDAAEASRMVKRFATHPAVVASKMGLLGCLTLPEVDLLVPQEAIPEGDIADNSRRQMALDTLWLTAKDATAHVQSRLAALEALSHFYPGWLVKEERPPAVPSSTSSASDEAAAAAGPPFRPLNAADTRNLMATMEQDMLAALFRPDGVLHRVLQHEVGSKPRAVVTRWHGGAASTGRGASLDVAGLLSPEAAALYRTLSPLAAAATQQRVRGGAAYGMLLLSPPSAITPPSDAAELKSATRAFRQQLRTLLVEVKPPVPGLAGWLPTLDAWRLFLSAHMPLCRASMGTIEAARDDLFQLLVDETLLKQSGPELEANVFCALAGLGEGVAPEGSSG